MYESRDANPYYQSADLDFDAARAEWERQGEEAGSISVLFHVPPPCDVCDGDPAETCPDCGLCLCDDCADTDEHREYCEMVQDGGAE